mgnify:CR=1 FL=1
MAGFKLGSENRNIKKNPLSFKREDSSVPGTHVLKKKLGKGILGESNNDGTIFISVKVPEGSDQEKQILMHEMKHQTDMKTGKLAYDDESISWMGEKYERKKGKINYNGEWLPEGHTSFPWEKV